MKLKTSFYKYLRIFLSIIIFFCIILAFFFYNKNIPQNRKNINNTNITNTNIEENIKEDSIKTGDPIVKNYGIIDENDINKLPDSNYIIIENQNNKNSSNSDLDIEKIETENNNTETNNIEKNSSNTNKKSNTNNNIPEKISSLKSNIGLNKYYTIQIASFKDFSKALELKKYFLSKKLVSFIVIRKIDNIYFYRVNIGIFKHKKDALDFYSSHRKLFSKYKPIIFLYSK